jgi:hypothetical protein
MINNLYIKATPAAASITWGSITGTLSSQTDLQNALDAKFDDPTGTVSQYVRGDGSLANFPASTGGGSSLTFYLNGSVAQGTFGGVAFKEMDRIPVLGAGTDFTIATNGYIQSFITDANVPNLLQIPAGNWNFETYFSASSSGGSPSFYIELYKWNGATLSLIASNSATPEGITNGTAIDLYLSAIAVPQTVLTVTDRLAVRIYVNNSGRTITLHTENGHLCEVITTFSTGLTALNGLTAQVQNLATGTSGTDFGISSATSTHTFNLPTASAANRGALSSADWTTFNNKQNALGFTAVPTTRTISTTAPLSGGGDLSANRTLSIPQATTSVDGYLTRTNFNTFNGKQAALVSGTNIKTINGNSLLGSGNLVVGGRSGVEVYQAPLNVNTYQAAVGPGLTFLFGSSYPLTTSTNGNIIKINVVFQAKQTISNTVIRFYASDSPTSILGSVQLGSFALTAANAAAGLDTIGFEKTFALVYDGSGYRLQAVDAFNTTNNDFSPQALNWSAIGGTTIIYPYICIALNQNAVLHSVTINYSR